MVCITTPARRGPACITSPCRKPSRLISPSHPVPNRMPRTGGKHRQKKSGGPPRAPRVLRRRRTLGPRDAEERVVRVDVRDTQARPTRAFSVAHAARRAVVRAERRSEKNRRASPSPSTPARRSRDDEYHTSMNLYTCPRTTCSRLRHLGSRHRLASRSARMRALRLGPLLLEKVEHAARDFPLRPGRRLGVDHQKPVRHAASRAPPPSCARARRRSGPPGPSARPSRGSRGTSRARSPAAPCAPSPPTPRARAPAPSATRAPAPAGTPSR